MKKIEDSYNFANDFQKLAKPHISAEEFLRAETASAMAYNTIPNGLRSFSDLIRSERLSMALIAAVRCYLELVEKNNKSDLWDELPEIAQHDKRAEYVLAVLQFGWLRKGLFRALDNHCPV